jgi:UTP--glucose-1-phosphate uridylyltransferase
MMITDAVVPVAGLGTRLLPATKSQPKEMLPVGKRPVVQYVVEELERNGIKRILFITGPNKYSIEDHFDTDPELIRSLRETCKEELLEELEFERAHIRFFYTRQKMQLGLGDAVLHAEEFAGHQPFVVALGDSIIGRHAKSTTLTRLKEVFMERTCAAVVAFEEVPAADVQHYGIADPAGAPDEKGIFEVRDLVEKPDPSAAPSRMAIAARYVFSHHIFEALHQTQPGKGGEVQLTDAVRLLLRGGETVIGVKLPEGEKRYDIGNFETYFRAFLDFALFDPGLGPELRRYARSLLDATV